MPQSSFSCSIFVVHALALTTTAGSRSTSHYVKSLPGQVVASIFRTRLVVSLVVFYLALSSLPVNISRHKVLLQAQVSRRSDVPWRHNLRQHDYVPGVIGSELSQPDDCLRRDCKHHTVHSGILLSHASRPDSLPQRALLPSGVGDTHDVPSFGCVGTILLHATFVIIHACVRTRVRACVSRLRVSGRERKCVCVCVRARSRG